MRLLTLFALLVLAIPAEAGGRCRGGGIFHRRANCSSSTAYAPSASSCDPCSTATLAGTVAPPQARALPMPTQVAPANAGGNCFGGVCVR